MGSWSRRSGMAIEIYGEKYNRDLSYFQDHIFHCNLFSMIPI